jgi:predicted RNA binding protein YcfA (HicA-like mRNA interferase family)
MSPKLPVISGDALIRALGKFGYVAVRQKGSHVRLRHSTDPQRLAITFPSKANLHSERSAGFSETRQSQSKNSFQRCNLCPPIRARVQP